MCAQITAKVITFATPCVVFLICFTGHLSANSRFAYSQSIVNPNGSTSMIIFSFDRAMQLHALLESTEKYVTGLREVYLIYRVSNAEHDVAYQEVFTRFKNFNITILKQGPKPREDFKPLLMQALTKSTSEYVMFSVDDIIVKDYIDLNFCAQAIEKYGVYGFYLRLGKNITYCYTEDKPTPVPLLQEVTSGLYKWQFKDGTGDWGYPNSVDMVLLKTSTVLIDVNKLSFSSPNTFEGGWASLAQKNLCGLCYPKSKIVNVVANKVQTDCPNKAMNSYATTELLTMFFAGKRIVTGVASNIENRAPHEPLMFTFSVAER